MDNVIRIQLPLTDEIVTSLKAGDNILLSGEIYTARDAAHKRLVDCLKRGEEMPIPIKGQTIYYVGPAPAMPGQPVGSCGPTTSYRMDPYAPTLIELGLKGMIGKGKRSQEVIDAMKKHRAVYFGAAGGAAALIARHITRAEVITYEDLGAEAIHRFTVKDLPVFVLIDCKGHNIYEEGPKLYKTLDL